MPRTTAAGLAILSDDPRTWRPQTPLPRRTVRTDIPDALVEPLWDGIHVLAHVEAPRVSLIDVDGRERTAEYEDVVAALAESVLANDAVLDGWLTDQATRTGQGIAIVGVEAPRGMGLLRAPKPGPGPELAHDREYLVAFVAVDLLRVDGEALLDVPLLERRRILESVVAGSDLVRVSPVVRPPLSRWLASWKAAGFRGATLKAANGRYVPGRKADDWYEAVALDH